jgi:3-hydroxybutyryl-CoA dehydrogenase
MVRPNSERDFAAVGVVGLGTMGAGIAEVFARNCYRVVGVEATEESLKRGRQHVEHSTARAVKRGKLSEDDAAELVGRITFTTDLTDVKDCGLVVEAVVEQLPVKQQIFTTLDGIVGPDAILATNTSSLSVTEISTATARPGRVVGLHFFNPAPVQALVEIIRTVVTEPDVLEDVAELARSLQKTPVICGDKAGFIANALLFGYLNHAASMFEAKYASREDLDAAMRFGCGYPMGPLALLDLIGLDTAYEILDTMYKQGRDRLHAPAPILKQLVTAGLLGRKSGRGFYTYEAPDSPVVVADALDGGTRRRYPARGRSRCRAAPDRCCRRGRHRHDGHRHRRGVRQGRFPGAVRRTQQGQGRRRTLHDRAVPGQGNPARHSRGERP